MLADRMMDSSCSGVTLTKKMKVFLNVPATALCAYAAFFALSWCTVHFVAKGKYSSIVTLSSIAHCLGLALLSIQVVSTRSTTGISARALFLDGLAVSLRLSSTLFWQGYLPNDPSGDYVYQAADLCALTFILMLLSSVAMSRRNAPYLSVGPETSDDDMCIWPMILVSVVLAAILHGDMDDDHFADTAWMTGLFVSVVAVLPQYWMIAKSSGQVQVLTAHYIAACALDRMLSGMFMWYVRSYITCAPWIAGFEHAICAILFAHLIHLALLSDFLFYYVREVLKAQSGKQCIQVCEL